MAEARNKRTAARKLLNDDIDPSQHKKDNDGLKNDAHAKTIEKLARDWLINKLVNLAGDHGTRYAAAAGNRHIPKIDPMAIASITHRDMIAALRKIESMGGARGRTPGKGNMRAFSAMPLSRGIAERNPAADLTDVLKPVQAGHFAAISTDELPAYLAAMEKHDARLFKPTRIALRLMMLLLVRTSELITTPWCDFKRPARHVYL